MDEKEGFQCLGHSNWTICWNLGNPRVGKGSREILHLLSWLIILWTLLPRRWCVGGPPCRAGGIFAAPSWLVGHLTISNRCEGGVKGFQLNGRRRLGAGMARGNRGRALGCKGGDGDVATGHTVFLPSAPPAFAAGTSRKFAVGRSRKSLRSNSKLR